jgi:toxin YoeB
MVEQIIWSEKAAFERREILDYWTTRNKSNSYSLKLNALFRKTVQLIAEFPYLGTETDEPNVRVRILSVYLIFYEVIGNKLFILTIWDGRRNPQKLRIR